MKATKIDGKAIGQAVRDEIKVEVEGDDSREKEAATSLGTQDWQW